MIFQIFPISRHSFCAAFLNLCLVFSPAISVAQEKKYADGHGGSVTLPLGDISFADEVLEFRRGDPDAITEACDSTLALNAPDFVGIAANFTSLGCGGSLSLRFTDNALINIPGPDLFVFEVGKFIETTRMYVSRNGKSWISVGAISGGVTSVDIGDSVKPGDIFHYVKLVDIKTDCKGSWPGADIDAVAAIGSGKQISMNSAVLYKFNDHLLLPQAKTELDKLVETIRATKLSQVVIEGHTDNTGQESYNLSLSEKRAQTVKDYLLKKIPGLKVKCVGYGSSLPVALNDTKEGQEKNRRVSVIILP